MQQVFKMTGWWWWWLHCPYFGCMYILTFIFFNWHLFDWQVICTTLIEVSICCWIEFCCLKFESMNVFFSVHIKITILMILRKFWKLIETTSWKTHSFGNTSKVGFTFQLIWLASQYLYSLSSVWLPWACAYFLSLLAIISFGHYCTYLTAAEAPIALLKHPHIFDANLQHLSANGANQLFPLIVTW